MIELMVTIFKSLLSLNSVYSSELGVALKFDDNFKVSIFLSIPGHLNYRIILSQGIAKKDHLVTISETKIKIRFEDIYFVIEKRV